MNALIHGWKSEPDHGLNQKIILLLCQIQDLISGPTLND